MDVIREVRARIQRHPNQKMKMALMATYLLGARASEIVGHAVKGETAYGPVGDDAWEDTYIAGANAAAEPVAVFRLRTAKKSGMERYVALPLRPECEPWARPLLEYFRKAKNEKVFPFTRKTLYNHARSVMDGLTYTIEPYYCMESKAVVGRHTRDAAVHFLRHVRATELAGVYGFTAMELAAYCGWSYRATGMSSVMVRYISISWQSYIPKLFKPCSYVYALK